MCKISFIPFFRCQVNYTYLYYLDWLYIINFWYYNFFAVLFSYPRPTRSPKHNPPTFTQGAKVATRFVCRLWAAFVGSSSSAQSLPLRNCRDLCNNRKYRWNGADDYHDADDEGPLSCLGLSGQGNLTFA